ncbi:MAG TPA: VCBS repeat-containing protein, partial [Roseiarcus sp.]|nr:VCBS repeat-containing protein [Roseiarcus sp.]
VGDFTGNGLDDILWRYDDASNASDPLNGALYEWQMNGTSVQNPGLLTQQPGSANWQVVGVGDFTGNGQDDILFRYEDATNAADPLNGITYIDFMNGTQVTGGAPTQWQVDNSWVVAGIGDYYGAGKSDILWQQVSTGDTYIWQMNGANVVSGALTSQQAGTGWTTQSGVSLHST